MYQFELIQLFQRVFHVGDGSGLIYHAVGLHLESAAAQTAEDRGEHSLRAWGISTCSKWGESMVRIQAGHAAGLYLPIRIDHALRRHRKPPRHNRCLRAEHQSHHVACFPQSGVQVRETSVTGIKSTRSISKQRIHYRPTHSLSRTEGTERGFSETMSESGTYN